MKFYTEEKLRFSELFIRPINSKQIIRIFRKLCRKYKLSDTDLRILNKKHPRATTTYFRNQGRNSSTIITMPSKSNLGVLVHEVAHCVEIKVHGRTRHNKRLYRIMSKINTYARNKNYWDVVATDYSKMDVVGLIQNGKRKELSEV